MVIDLKYLPPSIQEATGAVAICTMVCEAAKFKALKPIRAKTGQAVARAVVVAWIAYMSVPQEIVCDGGSENIATIMEYMSELFGVEVILVKAPGEHAVLAENAHKQMDADIERADMRGDLRSFEDVEVMCAIMMMKMNQNHVQNQTAFERTFGQPPASPVMLHRKLRGGGLLHRPTKTSE